MRKHSAFFCLRKGRKKRKMFTVNDGIYGNSNDVGKIFDKKIYFFCGDDEGRELVGNGRNAVFGKKSFHVDNERNADSDNGSFQGVGGEFTFRVINAAAGFDTVVGELNGATESFAFSAGKCIHRYN